MPGLLLILTEVEGERFRAGVELAATAAALGRPVALLLRGAAAAGLRDGRLGPPLSLLAELGVEAGICQTAMAEHGLVAADVPVGVTPTGMVAFLRGRADWQLVLA